MSTLEISDIIVDVWKETELRKPRYMHSIDSIRRWVVEEEERYERLQKGKSQPTAQHWTLCKYLSEFAERVASSIVGMDDSVAKELTKLDQRKGAKKIASLLGSEWGSLVAQACEWERVRDSIYTSFEKFPHVAAVLNYYGRFSGQNRDFDDPDWRKEFLSEMERLIETAEYYINVLK